MRPAATSRRTDARLRPTKPHTSRRSSSGLHRVSATGCWHADITCSSGSSGASIRPLTRRRTPSRPGGLGHPQRRRESSPESVLPCAPNRTTGSSRCGGMARSGNGILRGCRRGGERDRGEAGRTQLATERSPATNAEKASRRKATVRSNPHRSQRNVKLTSTPSSIEMSCTHAPVGHRHRTPWATRTCSARTATASPALRVGSAEPVRHAPRAVERFRSASARRRELARSAKIASSVSSAPHAGFRPGTRRAELATTTTSVPYRRATRYTSSFTGHAPASTEIIRTWPPPSNSVASRHPTEGSTSAVGQMRFGK